MDVSLDAGLTMFDSADVYSGGLAEEILGKAIAGRRDRVLISTKATFRNGDGPNDVGSSRFHLIRAVDSSLQRLGTDYIDLFQLHGFDALTPIDASFARARQRIERVFEWQLTAELRDRGLDGLGAEAYRDFATAGRRNHGERADGKPSRSASQAARVWQQFEQDFGGFLLGAGDPFDAFRYAAVRACFVL